MHCEESKARTRCGTVKWTDVLTGKVLYEAVAVDLKARCAEAFGIKGPVDMKIQNGLKNDLACVVRSDLEGVETLAAFVLAEFRKYGLRLAARFFEHYLGASGQPIDLSRDEAFEFDLIRNAVQENVERFKQLNFISPEQSTPAISCYGARAIGYS